MNITLTSVSYNWPPHEVADHGGPSVSSPPPRFNWKRDGIPVAAPSTETPKRLPVAHTPANGILKSYKFQLSS